MPEIAFSAAQAYRRLYRVDGRARRTCARAVELYQRVPRQQVKTGGRVGDAADNLAEMQRELDKLERGASARWWRRSSRTRVSAISVAFADQRAGDASTLREIGDATGETTAHAARSPRSTARRSSRSRSSTSRPPEHTIAVTAEGYFPIEKTTDAVEGQSSLVEVDARAEAGDGHGQDRGRCADLRRWTPGRDRADRAALELARGQALPRRSLRRGREPFARGARRRARRAADRRGAAREDRAPPRGAVGPRRRGPARGGRDHDRASLAQVHDGRASDLRDGSTPGNRPPGDADAYDARGRSARSLRHRDVGARRRSGRRRHHRRAAVRVRHPLDGGGAARADSTGGAQRHLTARSF